MAKWRAAFISDAHLGAPASQIKRLLAWLADNPADVIYLVGDILDGLHALRSPHLMPLAKALARAPRVIVSPGNHDDFLHNFAGSFARVEVRKRAIHTAANGRRYVVTHGDEFDGSLHGPLPTLGALADRLARQVVPARHIAAATRALNWVVTGGHLADRLSDLARSERAAGVITGHFHDPGLRTLPCGAVHADCGDWIANCTAVVEDHDGNLHLLRG